jgi:hypothetical protein
MDIFGGFGLRALIHEYLQSPPKALIYEYCDLLKEKYNEIHNY